MCFKTYSISVVDKLQNIEFMIADLSVDGIHLQNVSVCGIRLTGKSINLKKD